MALRTILCAVVVSWCAACGSDDPDSIAEVEGIWMRCLDEECESLDDDGFVLSAERDFIAIRRQSPPEEALVYCEAAFGSYRRTGTQLAITPEDAFADSLPERTVEFRVDGKHAVFVDTDGRQQRYLRVRGDSDGLCPGVHTDL